MGSPQPPAFGFSAAEPWIVDWLEYYYNNKQGCSVSSSVEPVRLSRLSLSISSEAGRRSGLLLFPSVVRAWEIVQAVPPYAL